MKRLFVNSFITLLSISLLLAFTGCDQDAEPSVPDSPVDVDLNDGYLAPDVPPELMAQVRQESGKLYIYDWAEWWPEEIFENFSEEFGIEVIRDHFASTEELVTKYRLNPNTEYDLLNPGPSTFSRLVALDVVKPLNHDWVPNFTEYIIEDFFDTWFNPNSEYGVLSDLTFTGIVYNTDYIDEDDPRIGSWALVFDADEFAGQITLLNTLEVINGALVYLGYDWNSIDEDELNEAKELLLDIRDNVLAFDSWPSRLLVEEEALISVLYSGDSYYLHSEQPNLSGFIPKEGTDYVPSIWCIPNASPNPATAHLFINYIFRPDVNQTLIEWIGYAPTHRVVAENLPQEMIDWPGLLLTDEVREIAAWYTEETIFGEGREMRVKIWEEIRN